MPSRASGAPPRFVTTTKPPSAVMAKSETPMSSWPIWMEGRPETTGVRAPSLTALMAAVMPTQALLGPSGPSTSMHWSPPAPCSRT